MADTERERDTPATPPTPALQPVPSPPPADVETIRIDLGETSPPLHANQRHHWRTKARITKRLRRDAAWLAKGAGLGKAGRSFDSLTVGLEWRPPDRRRRDGGENVAPMLKPLIDGLVDAGVITDDDASRVTRTMPVLLPCEGRAAAGMWLLVTPNPSVTTPLAA